jgi:hypothetical protein
LDYKSFSVPVKHGIGLGRSHSISKGKPLIYRKDTRASSQKVGKDGGFVGIFAAHKTPAPHFIEVQVQYKSKGPGMHWTFG